MPTHTTPVENGDGIVAQIVQSAATILDEPPGELPPLDGVIDTDLLRGLADLRENDSVETGHVTFDYAGLAVTVDVTGELQMNYR